MIKFPAISEGPELPLQKMTLREYAHFSEMCLRNNPAVTPENCLRKRNREKWIKQPFSLPW